MIANRERYLAKLEQYLNNGRVKIITGIRRCGKSFLLKELFVKYLRRQGVDSSHIIYMSLDDLANNQYLNPLELDRYLRKQIQDNKKYYIILDEIQKVLTITNPILTDGKIVRAKKEDHDSVGFVNVVLGIMQLPNVDLYISGSNSRFLSSDILTEFRDRGDEIYVQPLTFSEYVQATNSPDMGKAFNEYMLHGGMPMILSFEDAQSKEEYLKNLFTLTYHKDVEERNGLRNPNQLEILTKVMASNVGSLTNPLTIANTFNSVGKNKVSYDTISSYLKYLEEAFILSKVDRFDIRGKKHIGALYKYYFADPGLRNARLDFLHRDDGHVMENIIYNELVYRGYSVQVGVIEAFNKDNNHKTNRNYLETDFVASKGGKYYYLQSAYFMNSLQKQEQERQPLLSINDSFKKIIISRETKPIRRDDKGIMYIGIEEFLLNNNSMDL